MKINIYLVNFGEIVLFFFILTVVLMLLFKEYNVAMIDIPKNLVCKELSHYF